jgi:hypothetical protein
MNEKPRPQQRHATRRMARPSWGTWGLALLLLAYFALALDSARQKSVTVDELGHLPSGLLYLQSGDPRYATLNPPLLNVLSAFPVLLLELPQTPLDVPASDDPSSFWSNGYRFMEHYRADYLRIFALARIVPIATVACLGVLLFAWGRLLAPEAPDHAGLLAASLVLLSPNVLAQARLVGTDTGTAFFVSLALFSFRWMLLRPTAVRVVATGIALGLAQLAKFYALLLYPVMLALVLAWPHLSREARPALRPRLARFAAVAALSLLVLDTGYLWSEVGTSLADISLQSPALHGLQSHPIARIPLPLPAAYVRAFDGQLLEVGSALPSFLLGERFQGGRWYYYLALLAIKTPLPLLFAFALALALGVTRPALASRESALLLAYPALLVLLLSVGDRRQLGARALLSAAPLVQLGVAATLALSLPRRLLAAATVAILVGLAAVAWHAHPDYLSYFNEFAGGRDSGYLHASDANIDIGQDLVQLADYLDAEDIGKIQLLYFGSVDPALYGIDYEVPTPETLQPGLLAVSVSLYHMAYPMYDHGSLHGVGPVLIPGEPIRSIGGSIHLYRIPK